jgi:hypothetical protein
MKERSRMTSSMAGESGRNQYGDRSAEKEGPATFGTINLIGQRAERFTADRAASAAAGRGLREP